MFYEFIRTLIPKMKKKYVEVLQSVFDFYIRSKMDAEDMEYENIMTELWKIIRKHSCGEGCEIK